ncbi:hypothetical protein EDM76_07845 [bacterium]|nr:MAG: hypothetical protein EDM76_07845 [bacterium]MCL4232448.1 hypothetical protein [Dehalococcoidia bacterium]
MGLAARQAEEAGIPTLCLSSALDITRSVNPPRAAFLDFPLGHTAGKAHEPGLQRTIMLEALEAFSSLREPGQVKLLPFRWDKDDSWKRAMDRLDTRLPRFDTPQYQFDEDRALAEAAREGSCPVCGIAEE